MELKQFDPRSIRKRCVWSCIGARNTGKSVLVKDLVMKTQQDQDIVLCMTSTLSTYKWMSKMTCPSFVYCDGFDEASLDKFNATAKGLVKKNKNREFCFLLDDLAFDKQFMKCKTVSDLLFNGRHVKATLFITAQYVMSLPPAARSQSDIVIVCKDPIKANKKRLYEHLFGMFDSFKAFNETFMKYTTNYSCLVLDKTTTSNRIQDQVFWYRADNDIPLEYIGRTIYLKIHTLLKMIEDEKKRGKETRVVKSKNKKQGTIRKLLMS